MLTFIIFSHRARAINAKNISSKSAAHVAEILGIAPTPSRSNSLSDRPQGKLTSLTDQIETEKITTSTKSVTDYFKERLNARSSNAIVSTSTTPRGCDDSYDTPRMGLGSRTRFGISTTGEVEQELPEMDLSTLFSSSLVYEKMPWDEDSATTTPQIKDTEMKKKRDRRAKNKEMENEESIGEDDDGAKERKERKKRRKLETNSQDTLKELKKQERRKRKAEKLQVSATSPYTNTPVDEKPEKKERKKNQVQTGRAN